MAVAEIKEGDIIMSIPKEAIVDLTTAKEAKILEKWDADTFDDDNTLVLALWVYENIKGKYVGTLKESTPDRLNAEQMKMLLRSSIIEKIDADIAQLKETITVRFEDIKDEENF